MGFEPTCISGSNPKSGAYTNFATRAYASFTMLERTLLSELAWFALSSAIPRQVLYSTDPPGLEPGLTVLETAVLPITPRIFSAEPGIRTQIPFQDGGFQDRCCTN